MAAVSSPSSPSEVLASENFPLPLFGECSEMSTTGGSSSLRIQSTSLRGILPGFRSSSLDDKTMPQGDGDDDHEGEENSKVEKASAGCAADHPNDEDEEDRILCLLVEAFPSASARSLAAAYARAKGDFNKAAHILLAIAPDESLCAQSSSSTSKSKLKLKSKCIESNLCKDSCVEGEALAGDALVLAATSDRSGGTSASASASPSPHQFGNAAEGHYHARASPAVERGPGPPPSAAITQSGLLPRSRSSDQSKSNSNGSIVSSRQLGNFAPAASGGRQNPSSSASDLNRSSGNGASISSQFKNAEAGFVGASAAAATPVALPTKSSAASSNSLRSSSPEGSHEEENSLLARYPALLRRRSKLRAVASNQAYEYGEGVDLDGEVRQQPEATTKIAWVSSSTMTPMSSSSLSSSSSFSRGGKSVAATFGSVSGRMRRRPSGCDFNQCSSNRSSRGNRFGEAVRENENGLYSQQIRKQKNKDRNGNVCGLGGQGAVCDTFESRKEGLEFVQSMFGEELGIDVVRDVLEHFGGDTDNAVQTLLNMGSTSVTMKNSSSLGPTTTVERAEPVAPLRGVGGDGEQTARETSDGDPFSAKAAAAGAVSLQSSEPLVDGLPSKSLLVKMSQAFPLVEQNFLAAVLQASDSSYEAAFQIMKESYEAALQIVKDPLDIEPSAVQTMSDSVVTDPAIYERNGQTIWKQFGGLDMEPKNEKNPHPPPKKLEPEEVLNALFRTSSSSPLETNSTPNSPSAAAALPVEPWTSAISQNSEEEIEKPEPDFDGEEENPAKLWTSDARRNLERDWAAEELDLDDGDWNEFGRQRAIATEHWEKMKTYMKEAALAWSRGDREAAMMLNEKATESKRLAQEASGLANANMFNVQHKDLEDNIAIDVHLQHPREALQLLRLHLRSLSKILSVQGLTVVTTGPCPAESQHRARVDREARLKPVLTKYLDKRQIPWTEGMPGCIYIEMADVRALTPDRRSSDSSSGSELN